jgi:hypothetical protein
MGRTNHLICGSGPLLDQAGHLREAGYALRPPFDYDHAQIAASPLRIKDWDYYLVNDDHRAVALTFSDLSYIGMVSASVIDFDTATYTTTSELVVAPLGRMGVPASSETGDIVWRNDRCDVRFVHVEGGRRLSFSMRRFKGDEDLEVEFLLTDEPRDSMVICTPYVGDEHAFYYNRKIIGMKARGGYRVGDEFYEFDTQESLGLLDWGRGVWTYDNVWYWAAAQGIQDGHIVGLNLGYGFGDTSAASENMLFYDGKAHKLSQVRFHIPGGEKDFLSPWRFTSDDGRFEMDFAPILDRASCTDVGVIKSDQHQVFGRFTGRAVLDDGKVIQVRDFPGFAEKVENKW